MSVAILPAGTFKVADYRKPITDKVTREVLKRYRRDHRPPLSARDYDTVAEDFIPPQLDPEHIELIETEIHDLRTFGRKPGAEKTVTTRGSDVGEAARVRSIKASEAIHRAAIASKRGDYKGAAVLLASAPKPSTPKKKIAERVNAWPPKGSRKFASRER